MTDFAPTGEQQQALDLFATGRPLVIEAGAGTGKTSTLELLARSTPRTGCYVAFNKSIAVEARQRFPLTVASSTMHSLAYRALADRLNIEARLKQAKRTPSWKIARALDVDYLTVDVTEPVARTKMLQPQTLGGHLVRALRLFCESGDLEPDPAHFPYLPGIDGHDAEGRRLWDNNRAVAAELMPALRRAWRDVQDPDGYRMRFDHSHYLKVWQLGRPQLPGSFVLFDEAQDANGVMLAVLAAQDAKQMIYVGDSQQQIYEWRGAINALDRLAGERAWLTESFRFGQPIADVANAILAKLESPLRLTGSGGPSTVGAVDGPRAVLCRTNATALNVMLDEQRRGRAVCLVGGAREILDFVWSAAKLKDGKAATHPDLAGFDSWREVQAYVKADPAGGDLKMLVDLVDNYGADIIETALEGSVAEEAADVVVSTAHKAKGREWPTVRLAGDFTPPPNREQLSPAEYRLLYVAATRARERLDVTGCAPVHDLIEAA